jgi:hypothetical protein
MKKQYLYAITFLVILLVIALVWSFIIPDTLTSIGSFKTNPFDFILSANPQSGTANQGETKTSTIKVTILKGKPQNVQLSVSGCPAYTACILNPTNGIPTFYSTLKIVTSTSTPLGAHTITIMGVGGTTTKSTTYTLAVNPSPCTCSNWTNGACGGGTCGSYQRIQTRTCNLSGCNIESQCTDDTSCKPSCTNWNCTDSLTKGCPGDVVYSGCGNGLLFCSIPRYYYKNYSITVFSVDYSGSNQSIMNATSALFAVSDYSSFNVSFMLSYGSKYTLPDSSTILLHQLSNMTVGIILESPTPPFPPVGSNTHYILGPFPQTVISTLKYNRTVTNETQTCSNSYTPSCPTINTLKCTLSGSYCAMTKPYTNCTQIGYCSC